MKKLTFYKAIPSLFTLSAFIFGFNAIKLAIDGNIRGAIYSVIFASILDLFDGKVARALGADSKFGAELDSLSDLVCFGIATAFIVSFHQDSSSRFLYVAVCFFAICSMIRLARFNVGLEDDKSDKLYRNFFIGVPTPAGFILAIFPICLEYTLEISFSTNFVAIYMIIIAFLMVSTIPTPSTKGIYIPKILAPFLLGVSAFLIISFIYFSFQTIAVFNVLYFIGIIISCLIFFKRKLNENSI